MNFVEMSHILSLSLTWHVLKLVSIILILFWRKMPLLSNTLPPSFVDLEEDKIVVEALQYIEPTTCSSIHVVAVYKSKCTTGTGLKRHLEFSRWHRQRIFQAPLFYNTY